METKEISIPKDLYEKIEKICDNSEFSNVDEYVGYVLSELVSEEENQEISEDDEKKIKDRLAALGYIDD